MKLLVVLSTLLAAVCVSDCILQFQIQETFHGLDLLCAVGGDLSGTNLIHVESIIIYKYEASNYRVLASISSHYEPSDPVSHVPGAQVTGQLSNEDVSDGYLRITWDYFDVHLDGDYRCDLNGVDENYIQWTMSEFQSVQVGSMCPCFGSTPEVLRLGLSQELEAVCYVPDPGAVNITKLASLEIMAVTQNSREILAGINSLTNSAVMYGQRQGSVNGSLAEKNNFLRVVWEYPTAEMASEYICEGSGVGVSGDPIFFTKQIKVTLEIPDSGELVQRLFEMYEVQKELKRCQEERDRQTDTSPSVTSVRQTNTSASVTSVRQTNTSPSVTSVRQTDTSPNVTSVRQTDTSPSVTSDRQTNASPSVTSDRQTNTSPSVTSVRQTNTSPSMTSVRQTNTSPSVTSVRQTNTSPSVTSDRQTNTLPSVTSDRQTDTSPSVTSLSPQMTTTLYPTSCEAAGLPTGQHPTIIQPQDGLGPLLVLCHVISPQEVWTIFQKRFDGSVSFYRNFTEYRQGFGSVHGEHWLGLDNIRRLLDQNGKSQLRVDLMEADSNVNYTRSFPVFDLGPAEGFILDISGGVDDHGYGISSSVGQNFSTFDHRVLGNSGCE